MLAPLSDTPVFDADVFRAKTADWNKLLASSPGFRVLVEWGTMGALGPHVFVYPAGYRAKGFQAFQRRSTAAIDERWADFLEYDYIPKITNTLQSDGFPVEVICVDLRPVQVQRARRRALEEVGKVRAGSHAAHANVGDTRIP